MEKTLYYDAWRFNVTRIIKRVEKLVFDMGGAIVSTWQREFDNYTFIARYTDGRINENIVNVSNYDNWINFIIDGYVYHLSIDDNPFFDHTFTKEPISDDMTTKYVYYSKKLERDFIFDCLFKFDCSDYEIKEIANLVFNQLMNASDTGIYTRRVRHYYNNGRHYYYNNCPVCREKKYHVLKQA